MNFLIAERAYDFYREFLQKCYDFLNPGVVLKMTLKNNIIDIALPYIQKVLKERRNWELKNSIFVNKLITFGLFRRNKLMKYN